MLMRLQFHQRFDKLSGNVRYKVVVIDAVAKANLTTGLLSKKPSAEMRLKAVF